MKDYQKYLIEENSLNAFRVASKDHEVVTYRVFSELVHRFEKNKDYPYIDTKLSLIDGKEFTEDKTSLAELKGKETIYGWIQGRGLESLAGHIRWLDQCEVDSPENIARLKERALNMMGTILSRMEEIRGQNHGHVFFTMDQKDGRAFVLDDSTQKVKIDLKEHSSNLSDLFYSKGLLSAALLLKDQSKIDEAKSYLQGVVNDIYSFEFKTDQISFDPKNQVAPVSGKLAQGPMMIALGGLALAADLLQEDIWYDLGEEFITYLMENHTNRGQLNYIPQWNYFECTGEDRLPWIEEDGALLSDPGHALEFVGLSTKMLLIIEKNEHKRSEKKIFLNKCREILPKIFLANYKNGRQDPVGGIVKAYDLISKKPINDDMPWWSLPETMRAGVELLAFCPDTPLKEDLLEVICQCSNAFSKHFINEKVHLMAYQTLDKKGKPVDVIPATPDADPGYHTGLSFIDIFSLLKK